MSLFVGIIALVIAIVGVKNAAAATETAATAAQAAATAVQAAATDNTALRSNVTSLSAQLQTLTAQFAATTADNADKSAAIAVLEQKQAELANLTDATSACSSQGLFYNASAAECQYVVRRGTTEAYPAQSCKESKWYGSGVYWIDPQGTKQPFKVYCDQVFGGGGWTQVARIAENSDQWLYDSALWTTATTVGGPVEAGLAPGTDMKNRAYSELAFTEARMVLGSPLIYDGLVEGVGYHRSALALFTGSETGSSHSRGDFIAEIAPFSGGDKWKTQGGKSRAGVNLVIEESRGFQKCRYGSIMNNEFGDLETPDSAIGFGCTMAAENLNGNSFSAGGHAWKPDGNWQPPGYIFVR